MAKLFFSAGDAEVTHNPEHHRPLADLSQSETRQAGLLVFGNEQGMELVAALGKHLGGDTAILKRLLSMASLSGFRFGQAQEGSDGYHLGAFQVDPAETKPEDSLIHYAHNLDTGRELYTVFTNKVVELRDLRLPDRDLLSCLGYIYKEGGIPALMKLADPALSDPQVAAWMTTIKGRNPDPQYGTKIVQGAENLYVDRQALARYSGRPQAQSVLRLGDRGDDVSRAQVALEVPRTGIFNESTQKAVVKARADAGLPANGGGGGSGTLGPPPQVELLMA